jgi:hypothetical protein
VSSPSMSPPPQASRGGRRWTAGALVVLLAGGVALWNSQHRSQPEPVAAAAVPPAPAAKPQLAEPPPPPPPEPAPVAPPPEEPKPEPPKSGPKRPKGCDVEECAGNASVEIHSALRAKAGQVRSCYERALAHNAGLQGKVEVNVRIGPTGEVCSAGLSKDTLGDPSVTACVLQRFRSGQFPKPAGGCLDTVVPINFVPPQP